MFCLAVALSPWWKRACITQSKLRVQVHVNMPNAAPWQGLGQITGALTNERSSQRPMRVISSF